MESCKNFDNKRLASVAAKWWADQLDGNAKQDYGITQEDVDDTCKNFFNDKIKISLEQFQELLQKRAKAKAAPDILRLKFRKLLAKHIEKELDERGFAGLSVELEAEGMLALVAYYCNIYHGQYSAFPAYTDMFIEKGKIEVKYGKTATQYKEIFNLNKHVEMPDFQK